MVKPDTDSLGWMFVGLLVGVTTIHTAWPLTFQIRQWHHGLFMIAIGFAVFGYGAGKWRRAHKAESKTTTTDVPDNLIPFPNKLH